MVKIGLLWVWRWWSCHGVCDRYRGPVLEVVEDFAVVIEGCGGGGYKWWRSLVDGRRNINWGEARAGRRRPRGEEKEAVWLPELTEGTVGDKLVTGVR